MDWCCSSTMRELPPTATIAVRLDGVMPRFATARVCVLLRVAIADHVVQRNDRLREALERRTGDAGTNLPYARFAVGDAGVDDRRDIGVEHLARIDSGRRAAKVHRRQAESAVAAERDVRHLARVGDGILRGAAHE